MALFGFIKKKEKPIGMEQLRKMILNTINFRELTIIKEQERADPLDTVKQLELSRQRVLVLAIWEDVECLFDEAMKN